MLQRFLLITLTLCSLTASAQWQQTGSKVRYVNGLGIPTKDTAAGVAADSSQIIIRPQDSALYIKYKRTWVKVGGSVSGTTNYVAKFTSATALGNSQIFDNGTKVGIGYGGVGAYKFGVQYTQASNTLDGFVLNANTLAKNYGIFSANAIGGGLFGLTNPYTGFIHYTDAAATSYINNDSGYFSWHNSSAEIMRLTNSGNVGIGTASPSRNLTLAGSSAVYQNIQGGASSDVGLLLGVSGNDAVGRITFSNANNNLQLWTNSTEQLRITSAGNVGIGYTAPAAKIAVNGTTLINTNTDNGVDKLLVNGSISGIGMKQAYVAKTGAYTATDADYVIDCTANTFTVTLPASSGRTGRILIIKNSGAGTITVDGNGSETIDGAATYSISVQYGTIQIMSDNTNWKIIAKF